MENSQVGVFLAYAGHFGQALIDHRLYLPRGRAAADGARRAKTSVPEEVAFATNPVLACEIIGDVLDASISCASVPADAVYGFDTFNYPQPRLAVRPNVLLRLACDGRPIVTPEGPPAKLFFRL